MESSTTTSRTEWVMGILLVLFFLFVLVAPGIGSLTGWGQAVSSAEQRVLAPPPRLPRHLGELRAFRTALDRYWADHFGFREWCVQAYSRLMVLGLRTSSSVQVMLGRDGWLFYTGDGNVEDLRGATRIPAPELAAYALRLEERRAFVESQGGRYLLMIVPEKASVYADGLPYWAQTRRGPGRLDQIVDYLRAHTRVDVLDLRASLAAARETGRLYFQTDTHWTDRGAFVAYQALMACLRGWRPELQAIDDIGWRDAGWYEGDLARLLLLQHRLREPQELLALRQPVVLTSQELMASRPEMIGRGRFQLIESTHTNAPTLFVMHDSYMNFLAPYLPGAFSRTWFKWQPAFDEQAIRNLKPDFVVHEVAERFLMSSLRENPPGISTEQEALRAAFAASTDVRLAVTNAAAMAWVRRGAQVHFVEAPEGMDWVAEGPDPYVFLPAIAGASAGIPVVRVAMTSGVHTECSFLYMVEKQCAFLCTGRYLSEGFNEIYIPLTGGRVVGEIRFDPAETSGTYRLHALEIRMIPALPEFLAGMSPPVPVL